MASTNIQRVHTSAPTDNKKCTISVWIKRSGLNSGAAFGIYGGINAAWNAAGNVQIGFNDDQAYCWFKTASGDRKKQDSARVFRDTNAWYHFVYRIDTTQSTASDRIRVYCNNEEITSWNSTADPSLNEDISFTTNGYTNYIGKFNWTNGTANYFDGSLSHFHFCDGYSYGPDSFGEIDSTTGEWKIKTSPSVSYGNNGYFIFKDGDSLTDQSGNGNNWSTHNGTLTKTEDNPSNIFATLNSLASLPNTGVSTFTNGNTTSQGTNGSYVNGGSTLMMSSGKFYAEMKYVATSNASRCWIGITEDVAHISLINQDVGEYNVVYRSQTGGSNIEGGGENSYGDTWTTGDIMGIALDLDNNRLFFSKNGTWQNSGDPTSSTGAITTFTAPASTFRGGWFFASGSDSNAQNNTVSWNFGNGFFGTTAVSSAQNPDDGLGIFEYDVPAGYKALSTKGLNS